MGLKTQDAATAHLSPKVRLLVQLIYVFAFEGADVLKLYRSIPTQLSTISVPIVDPAHHQRRSTSEYGFNIGCLEGVNPFDLGEVLPIMA